jgi:hypothetical protein
VIAFLAGLLAGIVLSVVAMAALALWAFSEACTWIDEW